MTLLSRVERSLSKEAQPERNESSGEQYSPEYLSIGYISTYSAKRCVVDTRTSEKTIAGATSVCVLSNGVAAAGRNASDVVSTCRYLGGPR